MKVIKSNAKFEEIFPMKIKCHRVVDKDGFSYGKEVDFCGSELEIETSDIKKHSWEKYPDYKGTDFGVVCPVCGKFVVIDWEKIPDKISYSAEEIRVG